MTHDQPNPQHEPEDIHFSRVSNTVSTLAAGGIFFLAAVWGAYAWNFSDQSISGDPADWGAFGDFVGGIANPIFSFMTLMLLAMTLIMQARQLAISSKELKLSRQEIELSHAELRRSASAQELSEKALKAQALAAERTATISAISTLINHYENEIEKPDQQYDENGHVIQHEFRKNQTQKIRGKINSLKTELEKTYNHLMNAKSDTPN